MKVSTIFEAVELPEDEDFLSPPTREIAKQLGVGIVYTGEYNLLEGTRVLAESKNSFCFHMIDAAFETIIKVQSGNELEVSMKHLDAIYFDSLLNGILTLLSENRLSDIYIMATSLLEWYKSLVRKNGKANPGFATRIKEVSDQVEELGDNRIEYQVNSRIFGDLFSCGFQTIKETLQNNHYLCQGLESPSY